MTLSKSAKVTLVFGQTTFLPEKSDILRGMADSNPPNPPQAKPKPVDLWLFLGGLAVGIIFFLLTKTPLVVVLCAVVLFALLIHPLWNFWWIENYKGRQWFFTFLLAIVCFLIGYAAWPESPENSQVIQSQSMPTQATNHNELLNWQRGDPKNPPHVGFSTAVKPDGTLNILFNIQNPSDFPAYDISVRLYDMDNLPKSPPRLRDILHRSIANIDIPTLAPNVVKFIGSIDVPPTVSAKRFGAQFTTRVGAFFENIAAQRVKSNWLFAIQVRRFDASSEQIFLKVDPGFPVNAAGDVEW